MPDPYRRMPAQAGRIEWETTKEVAARLRRHPKTVERYARQGLIPSHQVSPNGDRLFDPAEVDEAIKSRVEARRANRPDFAPPIRRARARNGFVSPHFDVRLIGRETDASTESTA